MAPWPLSTNVVKNTYIILEYLFTEHILVAIMIWNYFSMSITHTHSKIIAHSTLYIYIYSINQITEVHTNNSGQIRSPSVDFELIDRKRNAFFSNPFKKRYTVSDPSFK